MCLDQRSKLTLALHQFQDLLGNARQAEHVDVESLPELLYSAVDAGRVDIDGGVVYQNVDTAHSFLDPQYRALDLVLNGHVALKRIELTGFTLQFFHEDL